MFFHFLNLVRLYTGLYTAHLVATRQNNFLVILHAISKLHTIILWHVFSVDLSIDKRNDRVINNDIELQKDPACFQIYRTDVEGGVNCLQGCFRKQTGGEDV